MSDTGRLLQDETRVRAGFWPLPIRATLFGVRRAGLFRDAVRRHSRLHRRPGRSRSVSAHIAIDGRLSKLGKPRRTAVDRRTTRLAKVKRRGRRRVDAAFTLVLAAYNLIRLYKLLAVPA
jgi:hypothetical protein